MIWPWLKGPLSFKKAPLTWLFVVLNSAVFIVTSFHDFTRNVVLQEIVGDERFLQTQGRVFADLIEREPTQFTELHQRLAKEAHQGHNPAKMYLGELAYQNTVFFTKAQSLEVSGDPIALNIWRQKFAQLKELFLQSSGQRYGLSAQSAVWWKSISYQFMHAGFLHLIVNLFFLIILGSFLEATLGGVKIYLIYTMAGMLAALGFTWANGLSMAPLVGASGAINGLMGVLAALYWRERLRFFYMVLPIKGYYGFVRCPVWVFIVFWWVSDLASLVSTWSELGGVAYSAHLSGLLAGLLMGRCLLLFQSKMKLKTSQI